MCSINIKQKQEANYTDPSAPSKIDYCTDNQQYYFCAGENKGNDIDYQACLIENKSAACGVANDLIRQSGGNGKKTNPTKGPSPCGEDFWVCDEVIVSQQKYESACSKPDEASCGKAPSEGCYGRKYFNNPVCTTSTNKTDNWSKCMGFIE